MKVWRIRADVERYASFEVDTEYFLEHRQDFDGRSHADGWVPITLESIDEKPLPMGDALGFHFGPLISERAVTVFRDLGLTGIEYLPFDCAGQIYYLPNVLGTIDCLEREKSKCLFSPTDPERVLIINRFVLKQELLRDPALFRLKDEPYIVGFVTETVVEAIRRAGLRGFRFELVWDDALPEQVKCSLDGVIKTEY